MVRQCPQIHRLQYNPLKSCNIIPTESQSATHQNASRFSRRIIALPGVTFIISIARQAPCTNIGHYSDLAIDFLAKTRKTTSVLETLRCEVWASMVVEDVHDEGATSGCVPHAY